MAGVNKVIIIGNLGNDPDMRYMPNGDAVANISVATSETWNDKQTGEKREKTEWHRIVAFRKLGEIIAQYCKKGSKVYIEGKLQTRKWTDKDGTERYTTEIIADQMQMLDSRQNANRPPEPPPHTDAPNATHNTASEQPKANDNDYARASGGSVNNAADFDDKEIPF